MEKRRQRVNLTFIFFIVCMAALTAATLTACGGNSDSDATVVDFSKRIAAPRPVPAPGPDRELRVAVSAMISPRETYHYYEALLHYIGRQVDRDIHLVQRKTYGEINELFPRNQIDMAFVCSGPYATNRDAYAFEAIATPVIRGEPYYQSYLIVHKDSAFNDIAGLRQKHFAFTDPDSNTGTLVPRYWLHQMGETPATFFQSTVFTYSHDNSIMAVAKGLVHAAAVDGHKWEYFQKRDNYYSAQTRVIRKSPPFGSPPLVVAAAMAPPLKRQVQSAVLGMHETTEGKAILEGLLIDRFVTPDPVWYEPVRIMAAALDSGKGTAHARQ